MASSTHAITNSSRILQNFHHVPPSCAPIGLDALYGYLLGFYPTQMNPIQVSAKRKYWLGGEDPLDYVSIHFHPGDRSQQIPSHWHYISMGLSDLHGDERVHKFRGPNQASGLGFELTFRLVGDSSNGSPPIWPAAMMQHLAKYAFRTGRLAVGDLVKWDSALDGLNESRIRHILLMNDAQLSTLSTPLGTVNFLQIVGICEEERKAVQKWNVYGVSQLLRKYPATGGSWLITDIRRGESIFDIDPCAKDIVDLGMASEGSNLSGIQAWCWWTSWTNFNEETTSVSPFSITGIGSGAAVCNNGLAFNAQPNFGYQRSGETSNMGTVSSQQFPDYGLVMTRMDHVHDSAAPTASLNPDTALPLVAVHLTLTAEAATFLPLALKGRLAHGRHFTFKSAQPGCGDITLLPPGVPGSFTTFNEPYAYRGSWLHIQIGHELQELLLGQLGFLESINNTMTAIQEPRTFMWPLYKLKITILPDVPGF